MAAALIVLGSTACATAEHASTNPRLAEAQASFDEGQKLKEAGQYAQAVPRVEHALRLREAALSGLHPQVADCLALLGELYLELEDHASAAPVLVRAREIREAVLGQNHLDVARSLNLLADLYDSQGLYSRAEPLYERALQIAENAPGENGPLVAELLNQLATLYDHQGLYARAEPLYQRAIRLAETTLGENHPDVAHLFNNLGTLYEAQGFYVRAEPLHQRALQIREAALGKNHSLVALSLHNLANLSLAQSLYARAEPLFERALQIWEAALGKDHPQVAYSLTGLALLYDSQGLYARAEPLYARALEIRQRAFGENHPLVARSLNSLATLYFAQRLYERAEPLYTRALQIQKALLGENHPDVALFLNNLAVLYNTQGLYERAEPLYTRALQIWEAALGESHPHVSASLHNLATLAIKQGRLAYAEQLYTRALQIREAAFGETHPDIASSLHHLALLHLARQNLEAALPLFERAFSISERHLRQEIFGFSEQRLTRFLGLLRSEEQFLYSLTRAHPHDARVLQLALSSALLRKGRSAQEASHTSHILYRNLGPAERETFERLRALRTQLATLALAGPGRLSPTEHQQRLAELSAECDALEARLARRSEPLRAALSLPPASLLVPHVTAALPHDGALVEFVIYEDRPLLPTPELPPSQGDGSLRYLALLLFPDGRSRAIDLGPAGPIDRAALRLHDALARQSVSYLRTAQALYALAFQPLRAHLGKTQRLFLSPDGQLNLVPFAALHDGKRFLVDAFHITYLTSAQDLLPHSTQAHHSPPSVVVIADPAFDLPPAASPPEALTAPELAARSPSLERFFTTLRSQGADLPWKPLPGTRKEAEAIHRLLPQAQLLLGPEATKQALLELSSPSLLHIATHGFFLEDAPPVATSRAVAHFGAVNAGPPQLPADPLLRSGLVLAGARPHAEPPGSHRPEDSLATALELAGLNLWGTQLVVLSACDTGRGDVMLGEGVYGLRRSLLVAGAETLVTSLWKVNDETTAQLMEAYYRTLLSGKGRAEALRQAMRALRQKQPHPHFWAPFVSIGRDAPLQGLGTRTAE